jgi:hypothetical protein
MRTKFANRLGLISAAAIAMIASTPASAAEFAFNFSGTGLFFGEALVGSGTITTDDTSFVNSLNGYTVQTITGITGTYNGSQITGLAPGTFGANNLFYLTGPFFVDGNGLGFRTATGQAVNLFVTNDTSYRVNAGGLSTGFVTASASAVTAAVPEPATWAMMLIGFGAMGLTLRRRNRATSIMQTA